MKVEETVRDDGLRIISARVPSKKVLVELICGVGSAYDPADKDGFFHFWEHMAFKGTKKRNIQEIASFKRLNIREYNAYTGRIETGYYAEGVYTKFSKLCDLLADIYFNSIFPPDELEREREVILNEIALANDNDSHVARRALWDALWQNNPLRKYGVGTPEGIKSVLREEIMAAKDLWYVPSNTTVIAVGNVHHNQCVAEFNRLILENYSEVAHIIWGDEYAFPPKRTEVVVERPPREKAIVLAGCKFPLFTDIKTDVVTDIMEEILVSGNGSILWEELREKRGLVYSAGGGIAAEYPLGNHFLAVAATLPERIDEVREHMLRVITSPVTNRKTFEETKEGLKDDYTLEYDNNLHRLSGFLETKIRACYKTEDIERYFASQRKILKSISLDDVEEIRQKTLTPEKLVSVIVKPA